MAWYIGQHNDSNQIREWLNTNDLMVGKVVVYTVILFILEVWLWSTVKCLEVMLFRCLDWQEYIGLVLDLSDC